MQGMSRSAFKIQNSSLLKQPQATFGPPSLKRNFSKYDLYQRLLLLWSLAQELSMGKTNLNGLLTTAINRDFSGYT